MSLMRMLTWAQQSLISLKLAFTLIILATASIGFAILRGKHAAQSHYWRKRAEARLHTMIKAKELRDALDQKTAQRHRDALRRWMRPSTKPRD